MMYGMEMNMKNEKRQPIVTFMDAARVAQSCNRVMDAAAAVLNSSVDDAGKLYETFLAEIRQALPENEEAK